MPEKKVRTWSIKGAIVFIRSHMPVKSIRRFFHWNYSGVFIPLFVGGVIGMASIALAIENSKPIFMLTYIFAFVALVWSLGYWLTCDVSGKWKFSVSVLIVLVFIVSCFSIGRIEEQKELSSLHGCLIPDNKPTPNTPTCQIPANGIALFFGNNSVAYITEFPHIVIQLDNEPLLIINKLNNRITLSGKFFSRDGKIVAKLSSNTFEVSSNNKFSIERPDRHTLIVFGPEDEQTLNVEFVNPSVIKIMSEYYLPHPNLYPNLQSLIIDEDSWRIGNTRQHGCLLGGKIDFHFKSDGSVEIESGPGAAAIKIGP